MYIRTKKNQTMKHKLLTALMLLLTTAGIAQVAPQLPAIYECDYNDGAWNGLAIFNLYTDAQIQIMAAQPLPADSYQITFHHSAADANAGINIINDFDYYISAGNSEQIYYRVKQWSNNTWVTGSVLLFIGEIPADIPNVMSCQSYVLPALSFGNYYTGPNGSGTIIPPGTAILQSQILYVYAPGCNVETSFVVTIVPIPSLQVPGYITACGSYELPDYMGYAYFTGLNGTGTQLPAGTVLVQSATIYLHGTTMCTGPDVPQNITIGPGGTTAAILETCDTTPDGIAPTNLTTIFNDFAALAPGTTVSYHTNLSDAQAGINAIATPEAFINTVPFEQQVFVRVANGSCYFTDTLTVKVLWKQVAASYSLNACDSNADGIYSISPSEFASLINTISQGDTEMAINFFATPFDAEYEINAISYPQGYTGTASTLYIGARYGTDCYKTSVLNITPDTTCSDNRFVGDINFDSNNSGCSNPVYGVNGGQAVYTGGGQTIYAPLVNGSFVFTNLPDGQGSISIEGGIPGVASVSPAAVSVNFPSGGTEQSANFCAAPAAATQDLSITLVPVSEARPGFIASYVAVMAAGAVPVNNVTATLQFDSSKVTPVGSIPGWTISGNTLTATLGSLTPFESTTTLPISFTVAQPPVADSGIILNYVAAITAPGVDATPENNTYVLNQTVVNSYDPNDINVAQGAAITPAQTANDLNYTIRFQNTGTASAIRVRVETTLDANLDWNSFRFVASDYAPVVQRNGNKVTFLFENINLPAEQDNEPGSHGYISYRIKPVSGIQLGESMQATASIYFDYNPAVVTNTVTTTVMQPMGIDNSSLSLFSLYPNPANGTVHLNLNGETGTATITDILGKTVANATLQQQTSVDISALKSGMYFVKVACGGKEAVQKLVVK